jgi:RNA polymerase sigma-70 factor (ECF subfamily)
MTQWKEYLIDVRKSGSALSYYKLVEHFEKNVFTACYRIIGNREEAEEASQDVFLKCFNNINQLEDIDKFPHWLLKIAYSKSIDYVRKKKKTRSSIDEMNDLAQPESRRESDTLLDQSEIFRVALKTLDEDERGIINLYYQEDIPVKEIVDITGMTASNIKIKLFRARKKIKAFLTKKET